MGEKLLSAFLGILFIANIQAQTVPNGGYESWTTSQSTLYEQPSGSFWTTLNPLRDLGGPVTVEKVTDACEGQFAAKLTTKNFSSLLVSGLLTSGTFDQTNLLNPLRFGQPFTFAPTSFIGCYKYSPVNGDSAAIVAMLFKWNTQTNARDTIAVAIAIVDNAVTEYTNFNLPFEYYSQQQADSITIVFSSSADGQNNNGQIGSALWIDNVSVDIGNGINLPFMPELHVKCYPNPFVEKLAVELPVYKGTATFTLLAANGTVAARQPVLQGTNTIILPALPAGIYAYTISNGTRVVYWGTLSKVQ